MSYNFEYVHTGSNDSEKKKNYEKKTSKLQLTPSQSTDA